MKIILQALKRTYIGASSKSMRLSLFSLIALFYFIFSCIYFLFYFFSALYFCSLILSAFSFRRTGCSKTFRCHLRRRQASSTYLILRLDGRITDAKEQRMHVTLFLSLDLPFALLFTLSLSRSLSCIVSHRGIIYLSFFSFFRVVYLIISSWS